MRTKPQAKRIGNLRGFAYFGQNTNQHLTANDWIGNMSAKRLILAVCLLALGCKGDVFAPAKIASAAVRDRFAG